MMHISVTGARTHGPVAELRFWRHAIPSMVQARDAEGNLHAENRTVDGVHHTLTAWTSEAAMQAYARSGAHLAAMRAFDSIATGETVTYDAESVPSWDEALDIWRERATPVGAARLRSVRNEGTD